MSLAGCSSLRIEQSENFRGGEWLEDSGNPSRGWFTSTELSFPLEEAWHFNAGAAFGPGSPLLIGEAVVVSTKRGEVYAVNANKGGKIGSKRFGESIEGTLLVDHGVVFIGTVLSKYTVTAFNLTTGKKTWAAEGNAYETGFVVSKGVLVGIDVSGLVLGRDILNGNVLWAHKIGDGSSTGSTPLVLDDGSVIVTSEKGTVISLDPQTGAIHWKRVLGWPSLASPSAAGSAIFIPTTRGVLLAIDQSSGNIIWKTVLGTDEVRITSPATDGEDVFVGTSSGKLFSIQAKSGITNWRFDGPHAFTAPPLITHNHVVIASMGRILYAFDRSAADPIWESKIGGRIKSALAARDGALYVLAEPRHVYKFIPVGGQNEHQD